jgi:hypothetical protein
MTRPEHVQQSWDKASEGLLKLAADAGAVREEVRVARAQAIACALAARRWAIFAWFGAAVAAAVAMANSFVR